MAGLAIPADDYRCHPRAVGIACILLKRMGAQAPMAFGPIWRCRLLALLYGHQIQQAWLIWLGYDAGLLP